MSFIQNIRRLKMDLERKYTEAEKEAINMSREMAGLGPLEKEEIKMREGE